MKHPHGRPDARRTVRGHVGSERSSFVTHKMDTHLPDPSSATVAAVDEDDESTVVVADGAVVPA